MVGPLDIVLHAALDGCAGWCGHHRHGGITAFVFPIRRPDLFNNSPANVRIAGIPVLPVMAVLSLGVMGFLAYIVLTYAQLGIAGAVVGIGPLQIPSPGPWAGIAFMLALVVVGLIIYFVARAVRAAQGVNLSLIYRELPPE